MERYNLKQYMFALSTVGMLHTACQFGPNRLGMMESAVADTTTDSMPGIKGVVKERVQYVHLFLHGLTNNSTEFENFRKYEKDQFGEGLIQITPEYRSQKDQNYLVSNDVRLPIKEQAKQVYEEYVATLKKILNDVYRWSPERINKEWQSIPLVITGSSQGGLVGFAFYKEFMDRLNIKHLQYIDIPAMGFDCFNLSLEQIQALKEPLNSVNQLFSVPVDHLCNLVDQAVQKGFGEVLLRTLLISHKDNPNRHGAFEKELGQAYINLVDILKDYSGVMDIHLYAKEMWQHIRANKVGNASETNNKPEATINLVASNMGNDTLDKINMVAQFIPDASSLLKASHGLSENDTFTYSDGALPVTNQLCKRRNSFTADNMWGKVQNLDKIWSRISAEDSKNLGYKDNVRIFVANHHTHSGLKNIVNSTVPDGYKGFVNFIPSSVFDDANCYRKLMQGVYDLGFVPALNKKDDTRPLQ